MEGWNGMGITTLRRRDVMRTVLDIARVQGDAQAPWRQLDGVERHFDDEADVLVELHREWLRLLLGRLHGGQIVAQRTPSNVRDLYDELCVEHPTLRGILDANDANPALWDPTVREHAMLARIAGLADEGSTAEDAASQGRALLQQRIPVQRGALV
jgi:hypothetical protein